MEEGSHFAEEDLSYGLGVGKGAMANNILKNKKMLLIIGGGIIGLIVLVIIIIAIVKGSNSDGNDEDEEIIPTKDTLGTIKCIYQVESITEETQIIGEEFEKDFDISIEINNKLYKFKKSHKFENIGEQIIIFHLHDTGISLNKMFKNVVQLTKVNFYSSTNIRVT